MQSLDIKKMWQELSSFLYINLPCRTKPPKNHSFCFLRGSKPSKPPPVMFLPEINPYCANIVSIKVFFNITSQQTSFPNSTVANQNNTGDKSAQPGIGPDMQFVAGLELTDIFELSSPGILHTIFLCFVKCYTLQTYFQVGLGKVPLTKRRFQKINGRVR